MGDVQPGVVSDHVVVDGEDGLGVRLDPGNLGHHGHQIIGLREEGEEANIIFIKIANIFRVGRRGPATLECFRLRCSHLNKNIIQETGNTGKRRLLNECEC